MNQRDKIYNRLPAEFKPAELRELAIEMNSKPWMKSDVWVRSVIDSWLFTGKAERIRRGIYRKLNQNGGEGNDSGY